MTQRRDLTEARFDAELRAAARSLVLGDLPAGTLETDVVADRPAVRGARRFELSPALALVVVVVLAASAALVFLPAAPLPPAASPTPAATIEFRTLNDVVARVVAAGYRCNDASSPTKRPGLPPPALAEATICSTPEAAGMTTVVIISTHPDGTVGAVTVKADEVAPGAYDAPGTVALSAAQIMERVLAPGPGIADVRTWLMTTIRKLDPGLAAAKEIGGFDFLVERHEAGNFRVTIEPSRGS